MEKFERYLGESKKLNLQPKDILHIKDALKGTIDLMDDFPDLYERLFVYYCDSGEMPYGVAKARTGMPDEWILDKLAKVKDLKTL